MATLTKEEFIVELASRQNNPHANKLLSLLTQKDIISVWTPHPSTPMLSFLEIGEDAYKQIFFAWLEVPEEDLFTAHLNEYPKDKLVIGSMKYNCPAVIQDPTSSDYIKEIFIEVFPEFSWLPGNLNDGIISYLNEEI